MTLKKRFIALLFICFTIALTGQNKPDIIQINTDQLSIILSIKDDGRLAFQYFGRKISGDGALFEQYRTRFLPDTQYPVWNEVYPAYGARSFIEPALQLTHPNGVLTTELTYRSHSKRAIDNNIEETHIRLKDKRYEVYIDVCLKAYQKENIISESVRIKNEEKNPLLVQKLASSYLPLHANAYYLTHFHGTWAAEMNLTEEALTTGIKLIETKKGVRATQSENPSFLLSLNGKANEESGEVYGGSLAWSGNYQLSFQIDESGILHTLAGMNPFASSYTLEKNEALESPEMLWTYSWNGKGQVSRNFHRWARKYGMQHGDVERPIVLNSWEGAYFNFNDSILTSMIDDAAELGVELFVLDDGWFGNKYPRDNDKAGLGDWQTNTKKLPGGIHPLAEYAHTKNVDFGIWIEPEMVNPKSELAEKNPGWIVRSKGREPYVMRNQWILDLTNPQVQDFIVDTFDEIIRLSPLISYVKWDANRHVENAGSSYLKEEEQSHFWIDYVQGLYTVYERIRKKHPDISIQLCSSGGGRLDYGALRFHDEFWASDNTNPLNRIFIQYGTNHLFPAIGTGSHVSANPNHQTGMSSPLKFRFDVAMSGRLGLELQPKDMTEKEKDFAAKAIVHYKRIRPVVQFGDLYRYHSPYDGSGWTSFMYISEKKDKAVFFAYSIQHHERTKFFECKLNGLDTKKKYRITELNTNNGIKSFWGDGKIFTGEELAYVGINLSIRYLYESTVLLLEEI